MSQDEFTKLFRYMTEHFNSIEARLENMATKDDIRHLERMINYLVDKAHIPRDVLEAI